MGRSGQATSPQQVLLKQPDIHVIQAMNDVSTLPEPHLGDIRLSPLKNLAVIKTATTQELSRCIGKKMSPLNLRELRANLLNSNVVVDDQESGNLAS